MSPSIMLAGIDARVLVALSDVPDGAPMEAIAAAAQVTVDDLRASMRRLISRPTEAPTGSAAA